MANNNNDGECFFSVSVTLDNNIRPEYEDSLEFDCDKTIGDLIKHLETEHNGKVKKFNYGPDHERVYVEHHDMDMGMTLQELFEEHGSDERAGFYVKIKTKKAGKAGGTRRSRSTRRRSTRRRSTRRN